jgi:hypothetical protein
MKKMTQEQVYKALEKAINSKTEVLLSAIHGLGSLLDGMRFQPYILGDDSFQYPFVWGYLPDNNEYYKFMLSTVVTAKPVAAKYDVREDACYQHAINEDHFGRLAGFDNIYGQAVKHR